MSAIAPSGEVAVPTSKPAPFAEPGRSSPAMNVWEGAVVIRRSAFDHAGGWPEPFWYAHEGVELAWRVWDAGFHVRYDGSSIEVHHPAIQPTRHGEFYRYQARNRVWLARRNLPLPVGVAYVVAWATIGGSRLRTGQAVRETLRGSGLGLVKGGGERRPMSWRTVWRMTRAGHPPLLQPREDLAAPHPYGPRGHNGGMTAQEPETTPPTESESPADETKRKFREALAAKKARQGEDHLDAGQTPGHAHGRVETKRTFRRKTG